jgi:hypothetical protein
MPDAAAIVRTFDRRMMQDYRILRRNARKLGRVLVHDADPIGWTLELIHFADADSPAMLGRRIILYDPRRLAK